MKRRLLLISVLALFVSPVFAQKVYISYEERTDFPQYRTFAWFDTPDTSLKGEDPYMHSLLKNSFENKLAEGGLIEDRENPDLHVTYHASSKKELRINVAVYGYAYGPGWVGDPYWGHGMGGGMGKVTTYQKGTLVIDIWDVKTSTLIWRGTATATVPEQARRGEALIQKAIDKMARKWRKMHKGG